MSKNKTFTMIKPNAVKNGHIGNILADISNAGFRIVALKMQKNAVEAYRNFIGATNPEEAAEGTIRKKYGASKQMNAVHGSDSDENAELECNFFFAKSERYSKDGIELLD